MEISYVKLEGKLRAAYKRKAARTGDPNAEVGVRCYCGGGFEMNITCTRMFYDEDESVPCYYMRYIAEDPDFEFDSGFSTETLKKAVKQYYVEQDNAREMADVVQIDDEELSHLEDDTDKIFESVLKFAEERL